MRCEIVSTDGLRNSKFVCPCCDESVVVGAAPQYLTGTEFPCTECFQPLKCLEHGGLYVIISASKQFVLSLSQLAEDSRQNPDDEYHY
jgi:hypothetical protein